MLDQINARYAQWKQDCPKEHRAMLDQLNAQYAAQKEADPDGLHPNTHKYAAQKEAAPDGVHPNRGPANALYAAQKEADPDGLHPRVHQYAAQKEADPDGVHPGVARDRDQQTTMEINQYSYLKASNGKFMVGLPQECCFGTQVYVSVKNIEYTSSHFAASVANGMLQRIESHFHDQGAAPVWSKSDVDTHASKLFSAEEVDALKKRAEAEVAAMWEIVKAKLKKNKRVC
jgi:hypothetical protein